jgi:hypothetical protein
MSSFDRSAWKNLDLGERGKVSEGKQTAINAVVTYLEQKLVRHSSKLPSYDEMMVLYHKGEWTYGNSFPDSGGRLGYRVVIRAIARVIHVHVRDGKISRAHFIRKLAENPDETEAKLQGLEDVDNEEISKRQAEKAAGTPSAYKKNLKQNLPKLAEELRKLVPKPDDRHEAIIFNADAGILHRYQYTGGGNAIELLRSIKKVINDGAKAQVITGAEGLNL